MGTRGWFQRSGSSSFELLLAEGDSVERSDRNVLQGTFCFQLSTVFPFYCYIPFTEVESSRTHLTSLASKLQVLENCPVLGSRTAVFLESLKFCRSFFVEKLLFLEIFWFCFLRSPEKNFRRPYYYNLFLENTCVCVLALEKICPRKGCPWPWA